MIKKKKSKTRIWHYYRKDCQGCKKTTTISKILMLSIKADELKSYSDRKTLNIRCNQWTKQFKNNKTELMHQKNLFVHGLRTSRESIFSKIRNFWAWADILDWNVLRHLGYFWSNFQLPFWYCAYLVHVFHNLTIISTKY